MSSIKNTIDSLTGGRQAESAARRAAATQTAAGERAITRTEEGAQRAIEGLQPFQQAGTEALGGLSGLVTDPSQQLSFIQDNPFFQSLADQATETLFANQAAKGKVGSGGTAEALQKSLVLLGTDLLNQNITQRQNLANLGFNAASNVANVEGGTAANVANLQTGIGNVQAGGIVAGQRATSEGRSELLGLGAGLAGQLGAAKILACDIRLKENIKKVGKLDNGLPIYSFNYKGEKTPQLNVMAQDVEKVKPEAVIQIEGIKYIKTEEAWH